MLGESEQQIEQNVCLELIDTKTVVWTVKTHHPVCQIVSIKNVNRKTTVKRFLSQASIYPGVEQFSTFVVIAILDFWESIQ